MFHDMDDLLNPGRKVLVSNALKILKTEMGYVQKGLLSDIPGMPMYYATGQLRTGFQTKRCVRGTPSLKGMHLAACVVPPTLVLLCNKSLHEAQLARHNNM